ncbi:odorant receptor 10-like [Euwallacea similis]|uniref:odorant receptor 10-like n=1 Tax=Euwallacea similis TaxID=1736056 RepID=UPI003450F618
MFSTTKWLLMASGSWRLELSHNLHLPYQIYMFFMRSIYVWAFVAINVSFMQNIGIHNDKAMEILSMAINITCCTIKLIICARRKVVLLLKTALEDHFEGTEGGQKIKKMLRNYKRYVRNLNLFTFTYTYTLALSFGILGGFVEYHEFQKSHPNATENPQYLITMWIPFDVQKHFDLALTVQMVVYVNAGTGSCSSLALFNTLMIYVVIKLRILQHKLTNFDNYLMKTKEGFVSLTVAPGEAVRNLKELIKEHQNLIRFVRDLDGNIKHGIFIEYSFTSFMLASMLLQLINGYRLALFVPYFMVLTFQLFLLSYNAEEIGYQSSQIGNTIYESDWYLYGKDVKWLVCMIMMRSQRQLCLNIGSFGPNSLKAAMARLKLAYSYTSVMSGNHV